MSDDIVLLIEDNANDVETMLLAFKQIKFPYKVMVARDGEQALECLLGSGSGAGHRRAAPILIILDLTLPKVSGLEVLRRLREDPVLKRIVVIVLTSSDEEAHRLEAESLGVNLYFRKPAGLEDVIANAKRIAHLLEFS